MSAEEGSPPPVTQWKILDKDLRRVGLIEETTQFVARPLVAPGLALVFIILAAAVGAAAVGWQSGMAVVIAAAAVGAYMALNIGANDVANNIGPIVGAGAMPLGAALIFAALAEIAGALIAGHAVTATIANGIVDLNRIGDPSRFIRAMLSALLGAALWLHCATWLRAPVSTTHSIVGGIVGAGVAAGGIATVNWANLAAISLGWVASPVLSGLLAAATLAFVNARILDATDRIAAARRWVPVLIGVMVGTFATYMLHDALAAIITLPLTASVGLGAGIGLMVWAAWRPVIRRQSIGLENKRKSVRRLFDMPLVAAAGLLSFGHGANDVSNAIGPLAAIVHAARGVEEFVPFWVMLVGALGISCGIVLFGPRLVRLVGTEITRLNQTRAFAIALATAATVILATGFGMPVSTTHTAIGAIFGVGFFREWDALRRARQAAEQLAVPPEERRRRKLLRRAHLLSVISAWVVTVPVSAGLAALVCLAFGALSF